MTQDEVQVLRIRLDPERGARMVEWARGLAGRQDEVAGALAREQITLETVALERCADGLYLILYQRAPSLTRASEIFAVSDDPFDREMMALIAETWAAVEPLEILLDVDMAARQAS